MGLTAAWRRQGAWATTVTFLVPGALALAVFTALLGGGFRGLGAIGQVLTGPQVPEARLVASAVPARHHAARLPTVPVLRAVPAVFGPRSGVQVAPAAPGQAAPASPVATAPPRHTVGPPAAGGQAPSARPAPPASRPGSPVRQAGDQLARQVGGVPVVGPAGSGAVMTVMDAVEPPPAVAGAVPRQLPVP